MAAPLAPVVLLCGAFAACDDTTSSKPEPEQRLVSLGMLEGSESWHVLLHDSKGSTRLIDLETDVMNLQRLAPPLLAFETVAEGRKEIHFLNPNLGLFDRRLSLPRVGGGPDVLVEPGGTAYITSEPGRFGTLLFLNGIPPNELEALIATTKGEVTPVAWSCSRKAVYLLDRTNNKMKRLNIETRALTDLPQDDWQDFDRHHDIGWFDASCDERTTAIGVYANGNSKVFVYRDGRRIASIEDEAAVEPTVSNDGGSVYYIAGYGERLNTIRAFDIETGETREVVGRVGAMGIPFLIEADPRLITP